MAHNTGKAQASGKRARRITVPTEMPRDLPFFLFRLEAAGLLEEVDSFIAEGTKRRDDMPSICSLLRRAFSARCGTATNAISLMSRMGLWRLQEVMREIAARSQRQTCPPPPPPPPPPSAQLSRAARCSRRCPEINTISVP